MNALKTLCLGMLLLVAALPGRAQIEVSLNYPNLDIFYIGDLDPFDQGGQIDNFEVSFRVEASGDYQVDLFLEYQGGVELLHQNHFRACPSCSHLRQATRVSFGLRQDQVLPPIQQQFSKPYPRSRAVVLRACPLRGRAGHLPLQHGKHGEGRPLLCLRGRL